MDPVVRQVGQHIEMEPEWEAAFTLQMKLTHIISMIQEWCASDVSNKHIHANTNSLLNTHTHSLIHSYPRSRSGFCRVCVFLHN